ncbi:MAG: replicative DNA helicase [Abditibacteriota bacterium]|nr:replicative DNA helicase [Abditibacteriota bacterium]
MAASDPRVPPQNIQAEQAVLGSMLMSAKACDEAVVRLATTDFYRPDHQAVFEALKVLIQDRIPVDLISVTEELRREGQLDKVGGAEYLTVLYESVAVADNLGYYAGVVAEKATLRRLINAGTEIAALAYAQEEAADTITETAEKMIFDISQKKTGDTLLGIRDITTRFYRFLQERNTVDFSQRGVLTGFKELDDVTSGLQPANLVIVAARPGMGKTAFALNIALHAALREGKTVAIFSLEMSTEDVYQRFIASEMELEMGTLRRANLSDTQWEKINQISEELHNADNIYIDDSGQQSNLSILAKCRRVVADRAAENKKKLDLIVIDYLQLMQSENRRAENRNQEISEIVRGLKLLAKEMDCPVMALSQVNRKLEDRPDKRPQLSDLRESGSIEQDADIVLMLHRPSYFDRSASDDVEQDPVEEAKVIIAKHRNGETRELTLGFVRKYAAFRNLAEGYAGSGN